MSVTKTLDLSRNGWREERREGDLNNVHRFQLVAIGVMVLPRSCFVKRIISIIGDGA
jgi:hypothetical protein